MICPNCNRVSDVDARACSFCGAALEGAPGFAGGAARAGAAGAGAAAGAWAAASARMPGLIERVKNILLTPKTEWNVIEPEPTSTGGLYTGYVMPLAAFAAVVSFLRMSVIGVSLPFGGSFRTPFLGGLTLAVVSFGFGLLGLYLVGLIINALAPTFAARRDLRQALKTAAYAFTPGWIASVLTLLGGLGSLLQFAAGCYGIYLLYLGLPVLMKGPREKATGYTVAVVVCTIIMGLVLGLVSAAASRFAGVGGMGAYGRLDGGGMSEEQSRQQAAAAVGNVIGGIMGADQKSKDGLGAAINNLADAGQRMEQQQQAAMKQAAAAPAVPAAATDGSAPSAAAATAGMLTALGGAMAGGRHVEPVDFHTLKELLPASLPDLDRSDAQGSSQQAVGVKESEASAHYGNAAGARAQIKISDISGVAGLLDVAQSLGQNSASESDSGFEKTSTVGGRLVHEKYENASKHGELTVIVAKRFSVEITGDGLDVATLERDLGSVDLARLEALKDYGAK